MKRLISVIIACTVVISGIYSTSFLPVRTTQFVESKYSTWHGVIRIWTAEGAGTSSWLESCTSAIEKRRPGVYLHIQEVPLSAIENYLTTGINPPDIIVYPSSASPDTSSLLPVTAAYPLRAGITRSPYAVPLLLYPRFWIYDSSRLAALPGDMYEIPAACREEDLNALVALSTGLRTEEIALREIPGADLGLGGESVQKETPAGSIPCRMGKNLTVSDSPRTLYTDKDADAFVGSISDFLKLSDKGDPAAAFTGEYAYAAGAIMISIVDKHDGRGDICLEYIDELMTEGQMRAARAQAFPAVTSVSSWTHSPALASAEAAADGLTWLLMPSTASDAARLYIEEKISADEAMRRIIGVN